jgi:hypothetical protein
MGSFRSQLRQRARDFFTNWRTYDGPFLTKLGLTLRNRTKSVVTLKGCCGHLGQPGC